MKRYRSHKFVEAAKIVRIDLAGVNSRLCFEDGKLVVTDEWLGRHTPKGGMPSDLIGGYAVRYADGYLSWFPEKAFEEGYTEMGSVQAYGSGAAEPADEPIISDPEPAP